MGEYTTRAREGQRRVGWRRASTKVSRSWWRARPRWPASRSRRRTAGGGAGAPLADLVRREGIELTRVSKSFGNDVLLALSCRESGVVLVTANTRDFARIARLAAFDFVAPGPAASA
jgi:hypothetical protein